ncbi:MAG: alpha/beta hydrolase [Hyphomicrobium sp.]
MMARRFSASDGVSIVYDEAGPADGVPVVLCHGLAASGEQFEADAAFFAEKGYRVLVPHLRGHGRSGRPEGFDPRDYSITRMATDLIEMLAHAGAGPVHWVGNSLGGILALSLLRPHREILRTLATFGTSYTLNLPRVGARLLPLSYAVFGADLAARMTAFRATPDREARALITRVMREFDPQVGHAVAFNLVKYDFIADAAAAADLPILMLRGSRDVAVNAALGRTLRAMEGLAQFTLVEVPGGGHCANLDAGEQVRHELLAFWAHHPG